MGFFKFVGRHKVAFFLLLAAATAAHLFYRYKQAEWRPYYSRSGGFAVRLPGEPGESVSQLETTAGAVPMRVLMYEDKAMLTAYAAAYADYPEQIVGGVDPDRVLETASAQQAVRLNGHITKRRKLPVNGGRALEFVVEVGDASVVTSQMYLYGNRLYYLMVVKGKGFEDMADVARFLDSFELT